MRIAIVDTYYPKFLKSHYASDKALKYADSDTQRKSLLAAAFGTSDFYSRHLNAMGHETIDLIANGKALQTQWAKENGIKFHPLRMRIPPRSYRLPLIGKKLAALPTITDILLAQIRAFKPDVLYCQDMNVLPGAILETLKKDIPLIVGQIACPLPPKSFYGAYDLILTSFPHFVDRLRAEGIQSEYFRIAFDTRVLDILGHVDKDIDVSFVGGISKHHGKAVPLLEYLARNTPIQFFGYGAKTLSYFSVIRKRHRGEVWGTDMYRSLARSKLTVNRHINVAENNANNMRLFEATGLGALLITDRKDNLGDLFEIGEEILAYSSKEEAADLISYYLAHPAEAAKIAKAGQARTLSEHTYQQRMRELVPILQRYLQR